jgi:hypothetical protein
MVWKEAAAWIELSEPFERIRDAITEAHRANARAA